MADFSSLTLRRCTAPNSFVGEFGKPTRFSPGAIGRGEVNMEPRALGQPVPDDCCLVSAVVIEDEMNVQIGRDLCLDNIQKLRNSTERPMPLVEPG